MRKITDINLAAGVLHWDQEVNMPPKGAAFRSQQLGSFYATQFYNQAKEEITDLEQEG